MIVESSKVPWLTSWQWVGALGLWKCYCKELDKEETQLVLELWGWNDETMVECMIPIHNISVSI